MVYKKRRHTHKTSINNSLNNSRSKKPRRIYRGGTTEQEAAAAAAAAAALALTGSATPPTTTPTTSITPQSDADEIKRLRDKCSAALEKTKKASRLARIALRHQSRHGRFLNSRFLQHIFCRHHLLRMLRLLYLMLWLINWM